MSTARVNFFSTIDAMLELSADALLVDILPTHSLHNNRARILRSGLVVSAFSHLEGFILERFDEILKKLPRSQVRYADFRDSLKIFLCVSSVRGLARKIGFMDENEALAFAEQHLPSLSGFKKTPPTYSNLGAMPRRTNLTSDDIQSLLKAFGVQGGWQKISLICTALGASRISIKNDFSNLHSDRNKCAHDSTSNIATVDLQTHLQTALLVGMAVDLALSYSIYAYIRAPNSQRAEKIVGEMKFKLHYLDEAPDGTLREHTGRKTVRIHNSIGEAMKSPSRPLIGFVVRDSRSLPKALA